MDPSDAILLLILFLLLLLSAFFSSAETSLSTVNRIRIRSLAEEGDRRAQTLLKIMEQQPKMLSAILVGNNVVNLSASSLATVFATNVFGNAGAGIATGILTVAVLVFGEISPKTVASIHSESFALAYASIIFRLMQLLTPVIFIINLLAHGFLRIFHVDVDYKEDSITESELRVIVDVSHEEGVLESEECKMINNVFDFGDSCAKDIMIPRINMTFIDVNASYDELITTFKEDMFTRIPVFEETTDNVIGIINVKDLLLLPPGDDFSIRNLLREAFYTYEFKKTSELFVEMKNDSISMAIVLDEYGATAGLITLEDLIEEIVGEIRDEYDADELNSILKISDKEYLIEASVKLDDLNDELGISLESEEYDSLGGFIIGLFDRLPEQGESVSSEGFTFKVESTDKNRIETIRLFFPDDTVPLSAEELS